MRKALLLIFYLFFAKNLFSGELLWNAYGHYEFDKVFNLSENKQIYFFNNRLVTTTSIGHNSSGGCKGHILYENNVDKGGFFVCESIDTDGEKFFTEFSATRGEKEAYGLQKFKIIAGTGKWEELIGQSCIGAWSQIRPLDKELKNASFLWNGKCEVPDKTLNRVKNYKKPQ